MVQIELRNKTKREDGKYEYSFNVQKWDRKACGTSVFLFCYKKIGQMNKNITVISSLGQNTVMGFLRGYVNSGADFSSDKMFLGMDIAFKNWTDTYEHNIEELNKAREELNSPF